jgi:hypothetical protein
VNDLFVMTMWAASLLAAHITFSAQRAKLALVMRKVRKGLVPIALSLVAFAPFTQAHSTPAPVISGTNVEERSREPEAPRDGISLDEAVRRAEAQFHARVVRTEVQDEDGRKVYVLKLLSEGGRVIIVRIDAATGRMR